MYAEKQTGAHLIENANMLHGVVLATGALMIVVHLPLDRLTRTVLAEVRSERLDIQETDKTEELANSILKRCTSQAPAVINLQSESSLGGHRGASLDAMGFVLYLGQ